jgi:hypothetical protein
MGYVRKAYKKMKNKYDIKVSINKVNFPYDNVCCENLFATTKKN